MEIRNPNKSHLPELHALLQRSLGGAFSPQAVADRIFYEEAYDPNHVWMAREGGKMLGFLHSVLAGDKAYIKLLVVAPERRRQGLGRDMLSRAEFRLSGEGAKQALVCASPPRDFFPGLVPDSVAESFFAAQGYEPSGEQTVAWAAPVEPSEAEAPDLEAAIGFAREQAPEHWAWVEESLACRPSQALYRADTGLLLFAPGESVGPLWPAREATVPALQGLAQAGLKAASRLSPRDPRGLRLHQVGASAVLDLPAAVTETYLHCTKTLR
jgi:GNAT superfamily N-acetyltransferase